MRLRCLLLLCFAVISSLGYSQFRFNEYSCANVGAVKDPLGVGYETSPDWIELINTSTSPQNLDGWVLSTDRHANTNFQITIHNNLHITVDSFGLQVIYLCTHNTETVGTIPSQTVDIHANFQLNQTQNPTLYLFNSFGGSPVDSIVVKRNLPGHSWGKPNSDSAAYYTDTSTVGYTGVGVGGGAVGCGLNAWRLYAKPSPGIKNPTNRGPVWYGVSCIPPNYYLDYTPTPKLVTKPGYYTGAPITVTITDTTVQIPILKDSLEIFATTDCSIPLTFTVGAPLIGNIDSVGRRTGTIQVPFWGAGVSSPAPYMAGVVLRAVIHDQKVRPIYLDGFEAYGAYILDSSYHMNVSCFCLDTNISFVGHNPADTAGTYTVPDSIATIFCYVSNSTKKQVFHNRGQGLINRIDFLNRFNPKDQTQFQFRAEDEYGYNYTNNYGFFTDQSLGITNRPDFPELIFRSCAEDNFIKGGYSAGGVTLRGATHLRDFFNHTITLRHKLDFESSHYVPTYMFINGVNRGIYYVKEPIDTTYTNYYFNQTHPDIIANDLKPATTTPQITALAGKITDWSNFYAWVMNTSTNVNQPTTYQKITDSLDMQSFWDYNFYNMLSVNADFVRRQALWWKGRDSSNHTYRKWRFGLSNTDITWNSNYNYTGLNDITATNSPCTYMDAFGPGLNNLDPLMSLFSKLTLNDTFKSGFFARYQDLLNTSYSCDTLTSHLAYVQSLIKPDIKSQVYWNASPAASGSGDTVKLWTTMVDSMNAFIMQRCSLALKNLSSGTCYNNFDGPYNLCINVQPTNGGYINFNSLTLTSFTWNGSYLDSVTYHANAVPDSNYVFDHWDTPYTVNPAITSDTVSFYVNQNACLTAVFKLKPPYDTYGTPMLPEAFSPNGDGNNDVLNVYGIADASSYSFEIYNRWGEQLFYSSDKTQGWDGTYSGSPAAVGVYAYRYNIVINSKTYIKNGSVTLLR